MKAFLTLAVLVLGFSAPAFAAGGGGEQPPKQEWSFDGPFGTYDRGALQRGLKVYREICAGCHGLKHVAYRNLEALGYNPDEVKAIAAEYVVMDGPNDDGEMYERTAMPSDAFVSPFPNDQAAKLANNGALPPDLSLITKARPGGPDYVHALLSGYEEAPTDAHLADGQYWNKYMSGHLIAMPPQLSDGLVEYEDGTPELAEQYASDVVQFLTWAADPYMEDRKRVGARTLIFLFIFAGVLYAIKRRVWSDQH